MLTSTSFWVASFERAVKTFAQALAAILLAGGFGLLGVPWRDALSTAAMAAVLSLLTSLSSAQLGPVRGSPSLVRGVFVSGPGGVTE